MTDLSQISLPKRLKCYWNLMRHNILHILYVGSVTNAIKFDVPYVELKTFAEDGLICNYKVTDIKKGKCILQDKEYTIDIHDLEMNEIYELIKHMKDD